MEELVGHRVRKDLQSELSKSFEAVNSTLNNNNNALRTELNNNNTALRTELNQNITALRTELNACVDKSASSTDAKMEAGFKFLAV